MTSTEDKKDRCPRCKSIFTLTWDSLGVHVYCDCTNGTGVDIESAKVAWEYRFKRKFEEMEEK